MAAKEKREFRLLATCEDAVGIVAAVTGCLAEHGGSIVEANQFSDPDTNTFFMRYVIDAESLPFDGAGLEKALQPVTDRFTMNCRIADTAQPHRVLILVSKTSHCLNDLLYRWRTKDMDFEVIGVVSNHDDHRDEVERRGIPYHHIPMPKDPQAKEEGFVETARLIDELNPQTIVLARYMQILPSWMCSRYPGRIINIHHSFLPAFAGARPYHQASERGVKLTGATCHYVTSDLDAGPIIEQDVVRISHHDSLQDIVRLGKDVEKTVLSRGLRYHLEDRVLVHGNKTVVFR